MTLSAKKLAPQKAAIIFQQIANFSTDLISTHTIATIDAIENEFMIKSDVAGSSSGSLSNLSKAIDIKQYKTQILRAFTEKFTDILTGKLKIHQDMEDDEQELSLMDETVIQENLLIDNFVIRITEKYKPALQAISKGLSRLSRDLNTNPEPQALAPQQLAYSFQNAIECLSLPFKYKPFIYNALYNRLLNKLDELYAGVLTLLTESEILKPNENPVETNYALICPYLEVISNFDNTEDLQDADDINDYTISDITSSEGTIDASLANIINKSTLNIDHTNKPVPAITLTRELFEAGEFGDTLHRLITRENKNAAQTGQQVVQPSELLILLSKLQSNQSGNTPSTEIFSQPRLTSQQVEATLKALHKTIKKRPSNIELNIIQLMNRLFIAILSDNILPDPIKFQISRLQIPYLKVLLQDASLLVDAVHPARLLLNEIASLGIGATQQNHPTTESIIDATQYILDQYTNDIDIFKRSYKKLRKIRKSTTEKVSSLERKQLPEIEKQAKLMYRKRLVTNTLKHILADKHLPEALHALALQGFAQILDKRSQQHGTGSQAFKDAAKLIRNIINSAQAYTGSTVYNEIFAAAPRFIAQTRTMLLDVYPPEKADVLLKDLENFYLQMAHNYKESLDQRDPDDTTLPMIKEQLGFNAPLPADFGTISNLPPAEILKQLPDFITIGSWFDVYSSKTGKHKRLKLVSILEDSAQLIFVNRPAKQTVIKNAGTFHEEINGERSRKVDTDYMFEKALAVATNNMQIAIEQNKI